VKRKRKEKAENSVKEGRMEEGARMTAALKRGQSGTSK